LRARRGTLRFGRRFGDVLVAGGNLGGADSDITEARGLNIEQGAHLIHVAGDIGNVDTELSDRGGHVRHQSGSHLFRRH
jgi:hypothetical protein